MGTDGCGGCYQGDPRLRNLRNAGMVFTEGDVVSVVRGSVLSLLTNPSECVEGRRCRGGG